MILYTTLLGIAGTLKEDTWDWAEEDTLWPSILLCGNYRPVIISGWVKKMIIEWAKEYAGWVTLWRS